MIVNSEIRNPPFSVLGSPFFISRFKRTENEERRTENYKFQNRRGLSLLEVLTALTIFMLSVVVISQMVDTGSQTALRSKRLTKAAMLCESKMAEVVAGIEPMETTGFLSFVNEPEPGWSYSITTYSEPWTTVAVDETEEIPGLSTVQVTVVWPGPPVVESTLTRMIVDPILRTPAPEPTIEGG